MFNLVSKYKPSGDQPEAIKKLVDGINEGKKEQVLLGATGTGKTFTIANVIKEVNKNNVSCYIQKGILEGIKKFIIELNNQKEYDKLNYSLSKILIRRDSKI